MDEKLSKFFLANKDDVSVMFKFVSLVANEVAYDHGFYGDFYERQERLKLSGADGTTESHLIDAKLSKIALVMSELGEMVEGVRKGSDDDHLPGFTSEEVEAADAIIRLLDYSAQHKLRIGEALVEKIQYNMSRPYKHGKKA